MVYIGSPELKPQVRGVVSPSDPIIIIDGVEVYDIDGYREYLLNMINTPLEVILRRTNNYEFYQDCESGINEPSYSR